MQHPHELKTLTIEKMFKSTLTLQGELRLNGNSSQSSGAIIQNTAGKNGPIYIASGGLFTFKGGDINYKDGLATLASTFTVGPGGKAVFDLSEVGVFTPGGNFGSDLVVDPFGLLELRNANDPIILHNRPTISNYGFIDVASGNKFEAVKVAAGDPVSAIMNYGTIAKTSDDEYKIQNPIKNEGRIEVDKGKLTFIDANPITGSSVYQGTATASTIITAGAELGVPNGYKQTAGTLSTVGIRSQKISGNVIIDGGDFFVGDNSGGSVLWVSGSLTFSRGNMSFSYDVPKKRESVIRTSGPIDITQAGTAIALRYYGGADPRRSMDLMQVLVGGTINNVSLSNPANYAANLTNGNKNYRLSPTPALPGAKGKLKGVATEDINADGVQDSSEAVRVGILVKLLDSSNTILATTTTDDAGIYVFDNLDPGAYRIEIPFPGGQFTIKDATDDIRDSDIDPVTRRTVLVTLPSGDETTIIAAGLLPAVPLGPGSASGRVWTDSNLNGIQDSGEAGVSSIQVSLLDEQGTAVATTSSGANGSFLFAGVQPGIYSLQFSPPSGVKFTPRYQGYDPSVDSNTEFSGRTGKFTLALGETLTHLDAGVLSVGTSPSQLSGRVWNDANHNGLQDAGESGMSGLSVFLFSLDGNVAGTATTNAIGDYLFANVPPDLYRLWFMPPSAYPGGFTLPNNGSDLTDSDADLTGLIPLFALLAGMPKDFDAGLFS